MSPSIDPDQKVYFRLNAVVAAKIVSRVEKFLIDGCTGNVRLNIRDGEILGVHCEDIVTTGPRPKLRRTA